MEDLANETLELTLEELNREKPCRFCIFSNDECTWCRENKIKLHKAMRGCRKFITKNDALKKLAQEKAEAFNKNTRKVLLKMNIMDYMINGSNLVLEKIDVHMDRSYKEIEDPTPQQQKSHQEAQKKRDKLHKAYKEMKFKIQDMRSVFNRYVQYYFDVMFTDENGRYDGSESDKNLCNTGIVTAATSMFIDRALENGDNADAIMQFMRSLTGSGILDEYDFKELIISK